MRDGRHDLGRNLSDFVKDFPQPFIGNIGPGKNQPSVLEDQSFLNIASLETELAGSLVEMNISEKKPNMFHRRLSILYKMGSGLNI
jgi:hypothetical protein